MKRFRIVKTEGGVHLWDNKYEWLVGAFATKEDVHLWIKEQITVLKMELEEAKREVQDCARSIVEYEEFYEAP
jgi:hypothetical protein